ncbi:MAG: sulfatase-like hydrolase/transferase [Bacteroidales bacterium]|nr:sulfatase-like hydrolase/transferase [Bacteroidales bacterium]
MKNYFYHIKLLLFRFLIIVLIFSISRLFFYIINFNYFSSLNIIGTLKVFFHGIRYDLVVICIFNSLFIIFHIIPGNFKNNKQYQKILKLLFIIINTVLIAFNFIDIKYFDFTNKRSSIDIFTLISTSDDVLSLMPLFIIDYWYVVLSWIILMAGAWFVYPKFKKVGDVHLFYKKTDYIKQIVVALFILGFMFLGARGSTGVKPLRVITAAKYTNTQNISLLLNTPFTILKTIGKSGLKNIHFFNDDILNNIYSPVIKFENKNNFKNYNVVIIILESFSKEYIGCLNNNKGYTPFLDSLIKKSLVFPQAFANGKKSIEAVPAIILSLPCLMENPYITSRYSANKAKSLATILNKKDYYTSFFHGGKNGTMGFDQFVNIAEFDDYYGRTEYNNENDFDGNWGIWDEEYLTYFANQLNSFKQPFFSCIFTLSSHHPYSVPEKYKGKFPKGKLKIHKSIAYTDFSLSQFFKTASEMPWFENTLFVLTADHTAQNIKKYYGNKVGRYAIPVIYFHPNDSLLIGVSDKITQQIDIMPSVLDYLNFGEEFVAFGNSVFQTNNHHFTINYLSGIYQLIKDDYVLSFDGNNSIGLYNYKTDSLLKNNLINKNTEAKKDMEELIKGIIQSYNDRLINNKLVLKN